MKRVALVLAVLAVVGCKKAEPTQPPAPGAAPIATGSATGSAAAPADDPWAKSQAPKKKDPLPHPLFWSLEKDGKTSYALGTIHVGIDAELRLPQFVWDKLDAAPAFAMETDLGDTKIAEDLQKCDKCSLKRELGPEYYAKLEKRLGKGKAAAIDPMQPAIAATMLSLEGMEMTPPMDGTLLGRAKNKDKRIIYLEPAALQAKLLLKWMNVKALKAMLDEENMAANLNELRDAYIIGDEAKMEAEMADDKASNLAHGYTAEEYDLQMKEMLLDRNASWIAPIEAMHAGGGGFIAVGAAHLIGKGSVLDLLTKKGFKVTRVQP